MKEQVLSYLTTECPWRDTLYWYDTTDSTNIRAKDLAKAGAPHGTVILAGGQTGGRGRMGRSFYSPGGMGVYLSVILRPNCAPEELMHLTCAAAVAAAQAVETVSGITPAIKWTNDLVVNGKKMGGILTELGLDCHGLVEYAIVGIGINCSQIIQDFPPELRDMATSVNALEGKPTSPAELAAALVNSLWQTEKQLLTKKGALMTGYKDLCMTIGQNVVLVRGEERTYGQALDVDENGGLIVKFSDGDIRTVTSGEISVRGMYGYA